jgi:hypothetical protein
MLAKIKNAAKDRDIMDMERSCLAGAEVVT